MSRFYPANKTSANIGESKRVNPLSSAMEIEGLGKALDVRRDRTRHHEGGRGDGSGTYLTLYINQCSITELHNICPLLNKLVLLASVVIRHLHWYNSIVTLDGLWISLDSVRSKPAIEVVLGVYL